MIEERVLIYLLKNVRLMSMIEKQKEKKLQTLNKKK